MKLYTRPFSYRELFVRLTFIIMTLLLVIVSVQAETYCLQTLATNTTTCNNTGSGNYNYGGSWLSGSWVGSKSYDDNSATYSDWSNLFGSPPNLFHADSWIMFNYTKPSFNLTGNSIMRRNGNNIGNFENYTIPLSCTNQTYLTIYWNSTDTLGNASYTCYNGTGYELINHNYGYLTRELAIYWKNCSENWINISTTCNGFNYTILYNDTSNCGTTDFLPVDNGTIVSCGTNCTELWVINNTACNGFNYTIQYFDFYNCNTTFNLPVNNGTIVNCSIPPVNITSCSENLCINPIYYNSTCCVTTPVINCPVYTYQVYNANATLISSGLMNQFINGTYYFMFHQSIGTYYVKICDDSTRQLIVVGDDMIGFTPETWLVITLFLLFVLFLWLAFKFDPLFMLLDGIIMVYFAYYSYVLYNSWFVTVLLSMIGLLFIIVGMLAKLQLTTK